MTEEDPNAAPEFNYQEMDELEFRESVVATFQQVTQLLQAFRADITELQQKIERIDARSERNAADIHKVLNPDE